MIAAIAAVTRQWVIGRDGEIPWHYSADLQRFKRLTLNSTVVMGRLTWESIGRKSLPKRRNIVVTSRRLESVETRPSIESVLADTTGDVWFVGGSGIYRAAQRYCELLDITVVPDRIEGAGLVYFPVPDERIWVVKEEFVDDRDPRLTHRIYRRQDGIKIEIL